MRARLVVILCWAIVFAPLRAVASGDHEAVRLTLERAIALSLADNLTLRAKIQELRSVRANEITAGLTPNPQFNYTASNLRGKKGVHGTIDNQYTLQATIETARKREKRVDLAMAGSAVTGFELDELRRQTVASVKLAFNAILGAQAKLDLARQNLKNFDDVERLQKLRAEKGDISELDLLRIQGQRLGFETDASDANLALRTSKIQFRQAVSPNTIPETFELAGALKARSMTTPRDQLYHIAMQSRPDAAGAEASVQKSIADLTLARAKSVPDLQPQAGFFDTHDNGKYYSAGVNVNIPIFDRNQGEIARAQADIERFSALREAARIQVYADVDTALATFRIARDKFILIRDTYLAKARAARDRLFLTYKSGAGSLLDYLDAERTYRETAKAQVNALVDLENAFVLIETAVGGKLK